MPSYRRAHLPGGTFFFTLVTYQRRPLFADPANIDRLRLALLSVRRVLPLETLAACVLPDHLHLIWRLPPGDSDSSTRLGRWKALFSRGQPLSEDVSRRRHGECDVWQRRFWEHVIRDDHDLHRHVEYIHYNPVKHGLAKCPHDWEHGSFRRWVERGASPGNWACSCESSPPPLSFPDLEATVGE